MHASPCIAVLATAIAMGFTGCDSDPKPMDSSDGGLARTDAGSEDAGAGQWIDLAPVTGGPRQETAVVTLENEIVLIAGYDENRQFGTTVEAYEPTSNTWRNLPPLPTAAHHSNAAVVEGKIFVLGFLVEGFQEDGRCYVYDPALDAWASLPNMPTTRERGSSVLAVVDDRIYVVGGLRNGSPVADFDRYDPANNQWQPLPPLPRAMDHGMGGAIERRIYIAGGRQGGIDTHTNRLDVFDLDTGAWSTGPNMPTSRGGGASAILDGVLYVFGGEGNAQNPPTRVFGQVEAYDPTKNEWRTLPSMVPARHGTGAAAFEGRIYVPGGANMQGFGAVDTHQAYEP